MENENINKNEVYKIINKTIKTTSEKNNLTLSKILLFGSRARKESDESSDYDILIVFDNIDNNQSNMKFKISKDIRLQLAEILVDADILVISKEEYEEKKNEIGSVIKQAVKEGITL